MLISIVHSRSEPDKRHHHYPAHDDLRPEAAARFQTSVERRQKQGHAFHHTTQLDVPHWKKAAESVFWAITFNAFLCQGSLPQLLFSKALLLILAQARKGLFLHRYCCYQVYMTFSLRAHLLQAAVDALFIATLKYHP